MQSILGVDLGRRYIGCARGWREMSMALPLDVIQIADFDVSAAVEHIVSKAKQYQAAEVVVGVPARSSDPQFQHFCEEVILELKISLRVYESDEQVSTIEAANRMEDSGISAKDQRKDAVAAMIILERFLERE